MSLVDAGAEEGKCTRVVLLRRFPTTAIKTRSISMVRFRIGDRFVQVHRPPFGNWMVSWPYVVETMLHPPFDDVAIYALRTVLREMIEGSPDADGPASTSSSSKEKGIEP